MVIMVHWLGADIKEETGEFMASLINEGLDDSGIVAAVVRHYLPRCDIMISRVRASLPSARRSVPKLNPVPDDIIVYLDEAGKRFRQR
jgi:hypothetical protein